MATDREATRQALESLRRAREEGESRTDQYVVQEHEKLVEKVTEEEYQEMMSKHEETIITESGQEDAVMTEAPLQAEGESAGQKSSAPKAQPEPTPPREPGAPEPLLQALQAGAQGTQGVTPQPSVESLRQKDLDDLMSQFCSEIDAGETIPAPTQAVAKPPQSTGDVKPVDGGATRVEATPEVGDAAADGAGSKRKSEEESSFHAIKQAKKEPSEKESPEKGGTGFAQVKVKKELPEAPQRTRPELPSGPRFFKVKKETQEDSQGSHDAGAGTDKAVKQEATSVAKTDATQVKSETPEPLLGENRGGGNQKLQSWLSGGTCGGVKVEPDVGGSGTAGKPQAQNPAAQLRTDSEGGVWFFFIDAFEDDRANPPRVYLFGKVQTSNEQFQSCCLVVEQLERCLHLLLNVQDEDDERSAMAVAREAEREFDALCREQCPGLRKLAVKLKWRNYAFEKPLPQGCGGYLPFLKVKCDASSQMPPLGLTGRSFRYMFGSTTSLLERLLITRRISGPSWLRLLPGSWNQELGKLSSCPLELRVTPQSIAAAKTEDQRRLLSEKGMPNVTPPVRLLTISMQTLQRSAQQAHEPVVIACTMHPNVSPDACDSDQELKLGMRQWVAVRRLDTAPLPRDADVELRKKYVENFNNEAAMLNALLQQIQTFDPDVIAGHNAYGFDLDVLASRLSALKLNTWQRLGRLRRPKDRMPRIEGRQGAGFWLGGNLTAGRLVCDLMLQSKDLLPKLGSYDVPSLAREQLSIDGLQAVEPENLPRYYDSSQGLLQLAEITFNYALCISLLVHSLQVLPLTRQLTNLAGNLWNASLQNKRAERNEMLLCHEFHRKKYVVPDKESLLTRKRRLQVAQGEGGGLDDEDADAAPGGAGGAAGGTGPRRAKAEYSGGLVLEPKVGVYDDFVMLLDFNSLYPSIIQEHNICFTTVERPDELQVLQCATEAELLTRTHGPDGTTEEGILPQVLRRLVESRRTVKMALKSEHDPKRSQMLEIRQKALKLTANSMYGCLGFRNSRFYAKPLAALITAKGREALQGTITVVTQELQLEVVYGDTDSVFVNTKTQDYNEAMQAAQQIKRSVNKRYKRLEIEIDAVFSTLMLLKKKKYAAVKIDWEKQTTELEIKGLDIVRRDWCGLAKDMGQQILERILSREGKEEAVQWAHTFLAQKGQEMEQGQIPRERYVITKGLTKDPKDYPDARNQPHVQVAMRLLARGKAIRAGQEVEYVICEPTASEGAKTTVAERARHPHELTLDPTLKLDIAWYKKQQVHPLVSRLLEPVEGTDAARIAECLGMDSTRFNQALVAKAAPEGGDIDMAYVDAVNADVNALFDRKLRWKEYQGARLPDGALALPGVQCLKCKNVTPWRQLLQPEVWEANGISSLFRCADATCGELINPRRAQNLFVMQTRELLKEYCMGWVRCSEDMCIEKTRRLSRGRNMVTERAVLTELEYMEYLCEAEAGLPGDDRRGCRDAVVGMRRVTQWLLKCNGYNWVDCGQIFGGIFGVKA